MDTSACLGQYRHAQDGVRGWRWLEAGVCVPLLDVRLSGQPFEVNSVHSFQAVRINFSHLRVFSMHGQQGMAIEAIILGCPGQLVDPTAEFFLQVVIDLMLVAEEHNTTLCNLRREYMLRSVLFHFYR
jgi:hypothetical protein